MYYEQHRDFNFARPLIIYQKYGILEAPRLFETAIFYKVTAASKDMNNIHTKHKTVGSCSMHEGNIDISSYCILFITGLPQV